MPYKCKVNWENELKNIENLGKQGFTYQDVGDIYGVSKQRIKQVVKKFRLNFLGKKAVTLAKEEAYRLKWGKKEASDLYNAKRQKFRSKKTNAIKAGKEFTVQFGELDFPEFCPILGIPLNYFCQGRQENSVSFDRIDPKKGYTKENTRIISWRANRLKNDGNSEEHLKISQYLDRVLLVCQEQSVV